MGAPAVHVPGSAHVRLSKQINVAVVRRHVECGAPEQEASPESPKALVSRPHVRRSEGSYLRCVDNSKIGREAMAEGRPPYIINVYSPKHRKKPHGAYGKLGDKVICAVRGEKIKGVIVGLKASQLPGVPRFDTNNVVLVQNDGSPLGTRIHAPIPKKHSTAKNVDFTKLLSIATKFV